MMASCRYLPIQSCWGHRAGDPHRPGQQAWGESRGTGAFFFLRRPGSERKRMLCPWDKHVSQHVRLANWQVRVPHEALVASCRHVEKLLSGFEGVLSFWTLRRMRSFSGAACTSCSLRRCPGRIAMWRRCAHSKLHKEKEPANGKGRILTHFLLVLPKFRIQLEMLDRDVIYDRGAIWNRNDALDGYNPAPVGGGLSQYLQTTKRTSPTHKSRE